VIVKKADLLKLIGVNYSNIKTTLITNKITF